MRIVILDGFTANPGDITWEDFHSLGDCAIYDRTSPEAIVELAADAEILLTNKTVLSAATIAALPKLRYIGVLATGYNVVDTVAAKSRGISVCNVPEYSTPNVAQAVFSLLLELTNRTGHHARTVNEGRWAACADFCYWDFPLVELRGLTLGIVGYGRIGQDVAKIAKAFGMHVIGSRRSAAPGTDAGDGVTIVSLETLFGESDVVSLHCPLTDHTRELINKARIETMKPSAFLINTARGALVNEQDLADALNAERIAGAGLDVLSVEPPPPTNALIGAKNCVITPHIAWATRNARMRLLKTASENVRAFLAGQLQNVVNP